MNLFMPFLPYSKPGGVASKGVSLALYQLSILRLIRCVHLFILDRFSIASTRYFDVSDFFLVFIYQKADRPDGDTTIEEESAINSNTEGLKIGTDINPLRTSAFVKTTMVFAEHHS